MVVDVGGQLVEVDQGASRIRIPQPRIVFDRIEADCHQDIGVADDDVAGLVAEQPDASDEVILEFTGDHAGRLERLDDR